jgi:hypothetical protein
MASHERARSEEQRYFSGTQELTRELRSKTDNDETSQRGANVYLSGRHYTQLVRKEIKPGETFIRLNLTDEGAHFLQDQVQKLISKEIDPRSLSQPGMGHVGKKLEIA